MIIIIVIIVIMIMIMIIIIIIYIIIIITITMTLKASGQFTRLTAGCNSSDISVGRPLTNNSTHITHRKDQHILAGKETDKQ